MMIREDREWSEKQAYEFLRERMSSKVRDELAELEKLREDIRTAQKFIEDTKTKYLKVKLKKKTLNAVKEEDPFEELAAWPNRESIREAYGYDMISEKEMDRLMDLWDLRKEQEGKSRGKPAYEDNVTIALDWAKQRIQGAFRERLAALEETEAIVWRDVHEIQRKHNEQLRRW